MTTSYEKTIKLACKPKAAPPKAKYMDPIIAATWSEDGAVHDVCKALAPRFREPNAIVVFKALIVLHTMIRNGSTDNVLQYLSSTDVLRLRNISTGHWEGYNAPQNMQNYSIYLDSRIRAFRDLKHDAIRVQSETNRDMRNSAAIEEDRQDPHTEKRGRFGRKSKTSTDEPPSTSLHQRSKTMVGRKLRVMTVEKGLLRETKVVQKMIDSLVECRFYLDDLEDELNTTALRMLVKDLLILFQACNEGVINVLEHYFEMSKIDAQEALNIYRHFCKETERVVEYLGVAKKLQNLLNVPIPNLRHAPVSLAGSLEEYLNDPNFEQNRIEYKTNKEIADRNTRNGVKGIAKSINKATEKKPEELNSPAASSSSAPVEPKASSNQSMIDFFSAIETEQTPMFNPQTNSPSNGYFQQQAAFNPFAPTQQQMMTGAPFGVPQIQMQPTGFMMPQQTAMPGHSAHNPFGLLQQPGAFGGMLQTQPTGFLVPQTTGANPFRQTVVLPQSTSMPGPFGMQIQPQLTAQPGATNPFPAQSQDSLFGGQGQTQLTPTSGTNPFPGFNGPNQQSQSNQDMNPFPNFGFGASSPPPQQSPAGLFGPSSASSFSLGQSAVASPFAQPATNNSASVAPPRPASAPLSALSNTSPALEPVKTHQTGSRNPFGVPQAPVPPIPKVPTLMELAMGFGNNQPQQQPVQQQQQQNGTSSPGFGMSSGFGAGTGSLMANVASSFAVENKDNNSGSSTSTGLNNAFSSFTPSATGSTATGSTFSNSLFSSLSSQPTGATSNIGTSSPTSTQSSLQPQTTGFGPLKTFKPSSSFGAALLESLPPIPQSTPNTPGNEQQKHALSASLGSSSSLNTQPTGLGGAGSVGGNSGSSFGTGPGFSGGLGGSFSGLSASANSTGFGSTVGVGLRPQATGTAGGANPFRATLFSMSPSSGPTGNTFGGLGTNTSSGNAFGSGLSGLSTNPTGAPSAFGTTGLGSNMQGFGSQFGAFGATNGQQQGQQQQNGQGGSLI